MNVDEAAEQLECKPSLVYKLCALGKLGYRRIGFGRGKIVITVANLKEYIESTQVFPFDTAAEEPIVRPGKKQPSRDLVAEYRQEQKAKRKRQRVR